MTHKPLDRTRAWKALAAHREKIGALDLRRLFARDPGRFERMSVRFGGMLLDYSKNLVTDKTMLRLFELARQADVHACARRMFDALGYHVQKLDRVYFAGLTKKSLRRGAWRYLTPKEVAMLKTGNYE